MVYSILSSHMESKRLSKALAAAGIASRRACEEIIFAGRVKINGKVVKVPQTQVNWESDKIHVDEELVTAEQKKVYYMLNKPPGYLCTNARPGKRPIVLDLFNQDERLFTVGRLDRDTTGLLLVTNDGHFAQEVIHPSSNIIKEYLVKTLQEIEPHHLESMSEGARVDSKWIKPVSVTKVRKGNYKICVKEGKKHEVRIIAERAGLKIIELTRIRIGRLLLGQLPLGMYRLLSAKDRDCVLTSQ